MPTTTWTHLLARAAVRPLLETGVKPNHLTTLRLATGLAACEGVALGTPAGAAWGGALWLVSAFLDRADGELARIGDMMSVAGHRYDYIADITVNALVFAAAGIGVRHGWLGVWAIPLGGIAALSVAICWVAGEAYQQHEDAPGKPYPRRWGFDQDDGLYLLAPLIWLHLMSPVVLGAALATSIMAAAALIRLRRLRAHAAAVSPRTRP